MITTEADQNRMNRKKENEIKKEYLKQYRGNQNTRPEPVQSPTDGFMSIPDGVDDEGLPFN